MCKRKGLGGIGRAYAPIATSVDRLAVQAASGPARVNARSLTPGTVEAAVHRAGWAGAAPFTSPPAPELRGVASGAGGVAAGRGGPGAGPAAPYAGGMGGGKGNRKGPRGPRGEGDGSQLRVLMNQVTGQCHRAHEGGPEVVLEVLDRLLK